MKIVMLTTVHHPFDTRIFHKEAQSLARHGHEVILIAQHDREERVANVHLLPLPKTKRRWQRMSFLVWQAFRLALQQRADVYHFHDPELLPIGILLKLWTRSRVVYDVHEDYKSQMLSKPWLAPWARSLAAWSVRAWEKIATRALDGFIAATPMIARAFPPSKTVVIHNFPKLDIIEAPPEGAVPYRERPPSAIYVGSITRIRGAVEMLEAVAHLQGQIELFLAGTFQPATLHQDLMQMPGWRYTRFLGWRPWEEIRHWLHQVRVGLVLLHPLHRHKLAFPTKLFEYMAAGIPFVASNFPLWQEIGANAGLFVDPLDSRAIAQAIQWLLNHPQEAERMGKYGQEQIRTKYNWEQEAQRLLAFYETRLGAS